MKTYRVIPTSEGFSVQGLVSFRWITIKKFEDEDNSYALRCANELLEKLEEEI